MKIGVYGLWHLGSVTAACLAEQGFDVIGVDADARVAQNLAEGVPPLFEPGLESLVQKGIAAKKLAFSTEAKALEDADIVWVTVDTPVDEEDRADVEGVIAQVEALLPYLKKGAVVLISSQLPAGSAARLEARAPKGIRFAYSPENLRLGKAIEVFNHPERIIVGVRDEETKRVLEPVLSRYSENILWMRTESAEMVKHGLNAFLATCITFINEIAEICEEVGADATEVERGLRSEPRIGRKAYIKPGSAFAGGTLARDVNYLSEMSGRFGLEAPLLSHVIASNEAHKRWIARRLKLAYPSLKGKTVAVLGLAYTPGTDTLRRSFAVELCRWLASEGAHIRAYDPNIRALPEALSAIALAHGVEEAIEGADALVVANEHPDFRTLSGEKAANAMNRALVIDQNGWLDASVKSHPKIDYIQLGKAA